MEIFRNIDNVEPFKWVLSFKAQPLEFQSYRSVYYYQHELFDWKFKSYNQFFAKSLPLGLKLVQLVKAFFTGQLKVFGNQRIAIVYNAWSDNYFHWFTEVLPRIHKAKIEIGDDLVFLFPFDLNHQYQLPSLEKLKVNYIVSKSKYLYFSELYFSQCTRQNTGHFQDGQFDFIKNYFQLNHRTPLHKIYISRKANKRIVDNEKEVIDILIQFGYEIVCLDSKTLEDQIELFSSAKVLVSIHGAALTNLLFMPNAAIVFEFGLRDEKFDKCYFNLSRVLNMNYFHLACNSSQASLTYSDANLFVDIKELKSKLLLIDNVLSKAV